MRSPQMTPPQRVVCWLCEEVFLAECSYGPGNIAPYVNNICQTCSESLEEGYKNYINEPRH